MKHPLENPSLAPFGFASKISARRLRAKPGIAGAFNREKVMAKLWQKWNRINKAHTPPITRIVHEIMPAQASRSRITEGDLYACGSPYLKRDIQILSSTVQWLATNVGECFLTSCKPEEFGERWHPEREFRLKLEKELKHRDLVEYFVHNCNEYCNSPNFVSLRFGDTCVYVDDEITERDRYLIDALMIWLGKKDGRAFIAEYLEKCERKREIAHAKMWEEIEENRRAYEERKVGA